MKKLMTIMALLSVVGVVVLAGCEKKESTVTPPAAPSTNAPAVPGK
jgi:uncharacterized lipoprotein YajG